jgi:hypothetical protein
VSRRRQDPEAELAAIEARHVARLEEIERAYADCVRELRRAEGAITSGQVTRAGTLRAWKKQYPGTRPMTQDEASRELQKRRREALEDYRRELETFELRRSLGQADTRSRGARGRRKGKRGPGRGKSAVLIAEADKAAGIYMANRKLYRTRPDQGAYAVHALYRLSAAEEDALSRPMIGHLIAAIENRRLEWDAQRRALKIPSELRTIDDKFVIPRKSAS